MHNMEQPPLWEMETLWFRRNKNQHIQTNFHYKSWSEFQEYKPYKLWKPYIVSSWSWKHIPHIDSSFNRQDLEDHLMDVHHVHSHFSHDHDPSSLQSLSEKPIELLQILFISPDRFSEIHLVEIRIKKDDEPNVRAWLKNHMPTLWKL